MVEVDAGADTTALAVGVDTAESDALSTYCTLPGTVYLVAFRRRAHFICCSSAMDVGKSSVPSALTY